jgi:hypothetical protein
MKRDNVAGFRASYLLDLLPERAGADEVRGSHHPPKLILGESFRGFAGRVRNDDMRSESH